MGNSEVKRKIWDSITANDAGTLVAALKKYPGFVNVPISSDNKSNAVTRAAYLDRASLLEVLVSFGADVNLPAQSGITGLMWAAARNNIASVKVLLQYGASTELIGPHNMKAVDFAVLFGSYNTALHLYMQGSKPTKTVEDYIRIKESMKSPSIDHQSLLNCLENQTSPSEVPLFSNTPRPIPSQQEFMSRNALDTWESYFERVSEPDILIPEYNQSRNKESSARIEIRSDRDLQEFDLD